jgi:hypothetical protein
MKIIKKIDTELDEKKLLKEAHQFLDKVGYKKQGDYYSRGSIFGNQTSLNPRKVKASFKLAIAKNSSKLAVEMLNDINTFGHIVTKKEVHFWKQEADALKKIIKGELTAEQALVIVDQYFLIAKKGNKKIIWIIAIVTFVVTFLVTLTFSTNSELANLIISRLMLVFFIGLGLWVIISKKNEK